LPGYYNIEISKDGYTAWDQSVMVKSEFVENFKNVVLFKANPEIKTLTDQRLTNQLNSPIDTLAVKKSGDLYYSSYELWVSGDLVTRFSEPISKAIWYPDKEHIIYQQSKEIRIIELIGTNDTLLVTLGDSNSTNFIINDKGDQLFYKDGGEYKVANIR
jgi:hypothetical protein